MSVLVQSMMGQLGASVNPLWDGLLAGWNGDNNTDDVEGNYNGTLVNGATYAPGIINDAFDFNGVNQYLSTGNRIGFSNTDNHSFSALVYFDDVRNRGIITNSDLSDGSTMGVWSDGVSRKLALLKGNGTAQAIATTTTLLPGQYYYLVIVHTPYDGVSPNVFFYVDGVADGSAIFDIGTSTSERTQVIGSKIDVNTFFDGRVDMAYIWNKALTPGEVSELFNGGSGLQK